MRYSSCVLELSGVHMMITTPLNSAKLTRFWMGSGFKVTSAVAGHDVTFPETVLTTTWYVFPGSRLSLNSRETGLSSVFKTPCWRRVVERETWYLSNSLLPLGGSQRTLNEFSVIESLSNVTFSGRSGTVRYCAVVGSEISSSDIVWTDMLYARPGVKPLKAAWAGPGGSPSFST